MIRRLIERRLSSEERRMGASLDYLRDVARASLPALFKFAAFTPLAAHRDALPAAAYHVARIVATQAEDCGTCVQIEVNLARDAGVPVEVVRAALDGAPDALPEELAEVFRFSRGVVTRSGEDDGLREAIRGRYGDRGLVELALGIAACRVFPTAKRALGHAVACARVTVELEPRAGPAPGVAGGPRKRS